MRRRRDEPARLGGPRRASPGIRAWLSLRCRRDHTQQTADARAPQLDLGAARQKRAIRGAAAASTSVSGVALAVVLAVVGIYGLMSYWVARARHEFGIRMALGAERSSLLRQVLGQGLVLSLVGVGIGIAAGFGLTRFLSNLLFDVKPQTADVPDGFTGDDGRGAAFLLRSGSTGDLGGPGQRAEDGLKWPAGTAPHLAPRCAGGGTATCASVGSVWKARHLGFDCANGRSESGGRLCHGNHGWGESLSLCLDFWNPRLVNPCAIGRRDDVVLEGVYDGYNLG